MLDEAQAALRSAEADHEYAAATAARYRQLMDRGLIAAQDYEQTESPPQEHGGRSGAGKGPDTLAQGPRGADAPAHRAALAH